MKLKKQETATMPSKFYMPVRSVLVFFLAYAGGLSLASAQDLTAEEILAKSKEAMQQPLSYRIVDDKFETTVYQKTLADGTKAVFKDVGLVDGSSPRVKKSFLEKGNQSYEIYFEEGIVLDTSFRMPKMSESTKEKPEVKPKGDLSSHFTVGIAQYEGRNCYQVDLKMEDIGIVSRYYIDQETFWELGFLALQKSGEIITEISRKDITFCPDLTDDFFEIPLDMEIKIVKNGEERLAEFQNIATNKFPLPPPPEIEKRKLVPLPPPTPTPPPTPLPQIEGVGELPAPRSSSRILFVVGVNVVFLAVIGGLIYRNMKKT